MPIFVVDVNRPTLFGAPQSIINLHTLASYNAHIYDGCEFGCAYCAGWSTMPRSLNESIRLMPEIARRARAELQHIDQRAVIGLTELSDPYQPAEQHYHRTRSVLHVLAEVAQPVTIMTKSTHVLDDAELILHIHQRAFAMVIVTVISHVEAVQARLEERCDTTRTRLETVTQLKKLGIPVGVALQPLIPYLNDTDYALKNLLNMIAAAGADFVYWDYLMMPNQRHRIRINETMVRVSNNPPAFLRELYREQPTVDATYRRERDQYIVQQCDMLRLPLQLPYARFAQRLRSQDAVCAVLLQLAHRDALQGREMLATHGVRLAECINAGERPMQELQRHAHYNELRPVLVHAGWGDTNTHMV